MTSTNLTPAATEGRYLVPGLEGVELEFGYGTTIFNNGPMAPFSEPFTITPGQTRTTPNYVGAMLYRTASEVGRNATFDIRFTAQIVGSSGHVYHNYTLNLVNNTFTNNVMTMSCAPGNPVTVPMGQVLAQTIARREAPEHTYRLDINCTGGTGTRPPVRVFFDGDLTADGVLHLSSAGQPGVAGNVGIELRSNDNQLLPREQANALPLTWLRRIGNRDDYSFEGRARYVPLGPNITTGRADATLTYILDYI